MELLKNEYIRLTLYILGTGIVGGVIAFLGNQLGRYIGRKKLSIFKLRPRYTSMLITVVTGMLIAMLTLSAAVIISRPIRTALVGWDKFIKEMKAYQELQIEKTKQEQQQTVLVYNYQDVILSAVVPPDSDYNKMKSALLGIISMANDSALKKSRVLAEEKHITLEPPPGGKLVGYIPENLEEVARELRRLKENQVIFVRANQNALLGNVFYVEIGKPIPNALIFKKDEMLLETRINGEKSYDQIFQDLLSCIVGDITSISIQKGMFPNPEDKTVGEIDQEYLNRITGKIKDTKKEVTVRFYSGEDTYIRGPLKLRIEVVK